MKTFQPMGHTSITGQAPLFRILALHGGQSSSQGHQKLPQPRPDLVMRCYAPMKTVHTATLPGKLARVGQHVIEELEPSAEEVLAQLDLEGEDEDK